MNRCSKPLNAAFFIATYPILALAGALFHSESGAQTQRLFPARTQRGSLTFTAPPQVLLDGRPERLGPGVRVRDARNGVALSGALRGKTFAVNYLRDAAGAIREVWILTLAEALRDFAAASIERATPQYVD